MEIAKLFTSRRAGGVRFGLFETTARGARPSVYRLL